MSVDIAGDTRKCSLTWLCYSRYTTSPQCLLLINLMTEVALKGGQRGVLCDAQRGVNVNTPNCRGKEKKKHVYMASVVFTLIVRLHMTLKKYCA